jgi:hypothetical protein
MAKSDATANRTYGHTRQGSEHAGCISQLDHYATKSFVTMCVRLRGVWKRTHQAALYTSTYLTYLAPTFTTHKTVPSHGRLPSLFVVANDITLGSRAMASHFLVFASCFRPRPISAYTMPACLAIRETFKAEISTSDYDLTPRYPVAVILHVESHFSLPFPFEVTL